MTETKPEKKESRRESRRVVTSLNCEAFRLLDEIKERELSVTEAEITRRAMVIGLQSLAKAQGV